MKYIIMVDYGYGEEYEEVEAEDVEEAEKIAYDVWKEGAESQAKYEVVGEWTEELAEDYL
ncbi:MAG: hypothetical protein ABFS32_22435 [Bacteroidota bacterium]